MYTTFNVSDLIFYEGNKDPWTVFPQEPTRGVVGCFDADRAFPWSLFVVVDYDKESKVMDVIMPRIRVDENNNVIMGTDSLTENFKCDIRCSCGPVVQGDDFCCHCGAREKIDYKYAATFKPVASDYKYKIIEIKNQREIAYVFFDFVTKAMVNGLDTPTIPVCCGDSGTNNTSALDDDLEDN